MKKLLLSLLAFIVCCSVTLAASVVPTVVSPLPLKPGYTPTQTDWANQITYVYEWVNANIVATMNVLTTKGDIYALSGGGLARVPANTNGDVLQANSALNNGLAFTTYTGEQPLTTKGDIVGRNSTLPDRVPVGTDGQILAADSSTTTGLTWIDTVNSLAFPRGSIIAWSPAAAGTSTVPTNWVLCDGNNSSPNLIGLFVLGTRPNGSSSAPAAGGYGAYTVDGLGGGKKSHSHTATWSPNPITAGGSVAENPPTVTTSGSIVQPMNLSHTHTGTVNPSATTATTIEPSDYALVYIMKQ